MQSIGEGHVYLLKDALTWRAGKLLEVEIDNIEKYLMDLAMEKNGGPERSRRRCESIFFKVLLYGIERCKNAS